MILPIVELIEWLIARGGIELINLGKLKEMGACVVLMPPKKKALLRP